MASFLLLISFLLLRAFKADPAAYRNSLNDKGRMLPNRNPDDRVDLVHYLNLDASKLAPRPSQHYINMLS
jgi:hypothetical protein